MKFIDKLERKFHGRGIENLTIYIIVSYVLGYALMILNPSVLGMLTLNVSKILQGQIWRLVTWVIYPQRHVGLSGIALNLGNVKLTGMVLACVVGMALSLVFYILDKLHLTNDQ